MRNVLKAAATMVALDLVLVAGGCAMPEDGEAQPQDESESVVSQTHELTGPNGVYFATVTANGTGCPRDSWDVDISPDGETFTMRFSAYEVSLEPGQVMKMKDCQIGVRLNSPGGLSYSVADFGYSGAVFLDKAGMKASQQAGYYFQGNPLDTSNARSDISGPIDEDYVFADSVGLPDLVWSPCGTSRRLNIPTKLRLNNNAAKTGTGYMNTLAADGSVSLQFRLFWATCS